MAAQLKGKEIAWKVGITCRTCEGPILAYPADFGENWVDYRYLCEGCNIEGPWKHLAKGFFEWNRKYESR